MSNISALLREAANEVANEEKEAAAEMFQVAAAEANQEILGGESSAKNGQSISERSKTIDKVDVNEDVHALLEQMSIKPKYSGNTIDDVDALLGMQKKKSKGDSRASMDQYRRRKSMRDAALASKSVMSTRTWGERSAGFAEQSRVSLLLSIADEKPWGQEIRYSFASPQQELLFRSMKVVRPSSGSSKKKGTAATVSDLPPRIQQKFRTSDLTLHAPKPAGEQVQQRNKQHEHMRQSADRLCVSYERHRQHQQQQGSRADPTLTFSRYDDAKECTFQPRITGGKQAKGRGSKRGNDDDDDNGAKEDKFAFLNRQEAEERNRRDEIEFQIGKANYDARVDKKACPQCGAKQSYDEFKEKRKSCVICNVEYCSKVRYSHMHKVYKLQICLQLLLKSI